jgi:uncharacterized protein (DUF1330 family)
MSKYPTPEQIQTLLAGPADRPVVMLNLLRFKERADAPDEGLTGKEAYQRYAREMKTFVESHGGRFLWGGSVDSLVIGDTEERFDFVGLVQYPSRQKFVEIAMDPHVTAIGVHREAGLEMQWLIATSEEELVPKSS